jgi:hypothetical protein
MTTDNVQVDSKINDGAEEFVPAGPTPELNPRNQILKEIAARANAEANADASESVQQLDEDGNAIQAVEAVSEEISETPAAEVAEVATEEAAEPAAEEKPQFDPDQEYELTINGQPLKVKGSQIIERGKMALQKEIAADYKLELASRMLQEAQQKLSQAQPSPQRDVAKEDEDAWSALTDEQLAYVMREGSQEQAAKAISVIRNRGQSVEKIQTDLASRLPNVINDQIAFHEAVKFVNTEYGDLLSDPYLKPLFLIKENELRQAGDARPYMDIYKEIGDGLRKHFNRPKTTPGVTTSAPKTRDEKLAAKAAAPSAPKLASARLDASPEKKPPTREEIIKKMQEARGQRAA